MAESGSEAAQQNYGLFTVTGERRMVLKLGDEGVGLMADRITWRSAERELWAAFGEISGVRLQIGQVGRNMIGSCTIRFRKGAPLTVTSADGWGRGDNGERASVYRRFVGDLHARLATLPAGTIEFAAGATYGRQTFGVAAAILGILFFICLPFVLLIMTGELQTLFLLIGGGLFVFPLLRVLKRNAPSSYTPNAIPQDLVP